MALRSGVRRVSAHVAPSRQRLAATTGHVRRYGDSYAGGPRDQSKSGGHGMLSRRAESDVEDVNDAFVRKDFEQTDTAHDIPELKNYYDAHKTTMTLFDRAPNVAPETYVAPSATLVGNVYMSDRASVGYGAVLRADTNYVHVGAYSHIGDSTVVTVSLDRKGAPGGFAMGNWALVGSNCKLSSCLLDNRCFVGSGSVVEHNCWVGESAVLAPGSVLLPFTHVPAGEVWGGNPAQKIRDTSAEEKEFIKESTEAKAELAAAHAGEFELPYANAALEELVQLRAEYRASQK